MGLSQPVLLRQWSLAYLVMTTLFTRNVNRNLIKSIALEAQNEALIDELNQEVHRRESLVEQRTGELRKKNQELIGEVAERRRVEAALRTSEERFDLAMRGANDGLFDWNLDRNEIYYSPRWKSMLGYADEELENDFSVWEDLVDPRDRERSWDMLTDYINGRRDSFSLEFRMRHKDGHWVDILSRAFLVRNPDGKAVRVVGTHVDISEKKIQGRPSHPGSPHANAKHGQDIQNENNRDGARKLRHHWAWGQRAMALSSEQKVVSA